MKLRDALIERGVSLNVVDRVMKFYPANTDVREVQGSLLRGLQYKRRPYWLGYLGKREFISRHGRDAWEALPKCLKYRDGRRQWVSIDTAMDHLWLVYQGKSEAKMAAFPANNRYASDPDCRIEIRAIAA